MCLNIASPHLVATVDDGVGDCPCLANLNQLLDAGQVNLYLAKLDGRLDADMYLFFAFAESTQPGRQRKAWGYLWPHIP